MFGILALLLVVAPFVGRAVHAERSGGGGGPSEYETISVMANAARSRQSGASMYAAPERDGLPGVPDPEHMANVMDGWQRPSAAASPSYLETSSISRSRPLQQQQQRQRRREQRRESRGRYNPRVSQQLNYRASSPYQRQMETNRYSDAGSNLETASRTWRSQRFRRAEQRQRAIRVAERRARYGNDNVNDNVNVNNNNNNNNSPLSYIEESAATSKSLHADNDNAVGSENNRQSASMVAKVRAFKVFTHVGAAFLQSFIAEESGEDDSNSAVPQFDVSQLNTNARRRMARERRRGFSQGRRRPREQGRLGSHAYEDFSALQIDQKELTPRTPVLGESFDKVVKVLTLEPVTVELEIGADARLKQREHVQRDENAASKKNQKQKNGVIESLHLMTIPSFPKANANANSDVLLEKKSAQPITVTSTKTVTKTTTAADTAPKAQQDKQDLARLSRATMFATPTTTSSMRFNELPKSVTPSTAADNMPAPVSRFQELEDSRQARYQQYKARSRRTAAPRQLDSAPSKHEYVPENHHPHRAAMVNDHHSDNKNNNNKFEDVGRDMRFTELDARVKADSQAGAKTKTSTKVRTGIFSSIVGFVRKMMGGGGEEGSRNKAAQFEDCVGCRFVWGEVEMDVGSARYIEDVQASFEHNCMDAQKSTIFYAVCEDMYDDMYAMTDDYMANKFNIEKMCQRGMFCKS